MKNPLVSVVVPSYNHSKFIEAALRSINEQTYKNIEIIVVDDGSTDNSAEIINHFSKSCRRPLTFIRQKNSGAARALNVGLKKARGRYLTILNSDDLFTNDRIECLIKAALEKKHPFLISEVHMINEAGQPLCSRNPIFGWYQEAISYRHHYPSLSFALLRWGLMVTTGNLFFTKELFQKIGGFKNYRWTHDYDFTLRACVLTEPYFVSKKLYSYRVHDQNTIHTRGIKFNNEFRRVFENYFEECLLNKTSINDKQNRYSPRPENYHKIFTEFYKTEYGIFENGGSCEQALSLCNKYFLKRNADLKPALNFVEGDTDRLCKALHSFNGALNLHKNNFNLEYTTNTPKYKIYKSYPCRANNSSIGTFVQVISADNKPKQKNELQDSYLGLFSNNRLLSVARSIDTSRMGHLYLAFITAQLCAEELNKLKFYPIEMTGRNQYKILVNRNEKIYPPTKYGFFDHIFFDKTRLKIIGWSIFARKIPQSVHIYIDQKPLPFMPNLMPRPDLATLLLKHEDSRIAGFCFDFDFKDSGFGLPDGAHTLSVLATFKDNLKFEMPIEIIFDGHSFALKK